MDEIEVFLINNGGQIANQRVPVADRREVAGRMAKPKSACVVWQRQSWYRPVRRVKESLVYSVVNLGRKHMAVPIRIVQQRNPSRSMDTVGETDKKYFHAGDFHRGVAEPKVLVNKMSQHIRSQLVE
jgi:hypothetical protein